MKRNQGVTLIELMVTISIAAILMMVAVPGMQSFVRNNRVAGTTHEITGFLNFARSEAIKRGNSITVCSDADGNNTCEATTDWNDGMVLLANATPLRRIGAVPSAVITSSGDSIVFGARGTVATATTITISNGTCPDRSASLLSIMSTGRIAISEVPCP